MLVGKADVVHHRHHLGRVVDGALDAVAWIGTARDVPRDAHLIHGTLVHGDARLVEPSLRLQMTGEVGEERQEVLLVGFFAGLTGNRLQCASSHVYILEAVAPKYNGVAIDLLRHAARHHELYPAVEHRVVVRPTPVDSLHLHNHALEGVLRLTVPRMLDDAGGDDLAARFGIHFHQRAHTVKVFFAPEGHAEVARHGVGVLPEVEVELPVLRLRQDTFADSKFDGQAQRSAFKRDAYRSAVLPRRSILRHADVKPHGAISACLHTARWLRVKTVCHEAGVLSVLAIPVCQHIADKVPTDAVSRNDILPALQVADAKRDFQVPIYTIQTNNSLCANAFASPSTQHGRGGNFGRIERHLVIAHIR